MLKRWAGWPRGVEWLPWIAAVVLALAIAWTLFVPIANWLAHHDVGSATGPLHETALDNARGRLLTLGAALVALVALAFTGRTFYLSREGHVTDRYTKAIEQLGSDKLDVRIGGIYALERVARDSARDHPTVMEVLTAFIREHSREPWAPPDPGGPEQERSTRPDIQAAVTVVGRRDAKRDIRPIDLSSASLPGADLSGADLTGAKLGRVSLTYADLSEANLSDADLDDADLTGANLGGAHLILAKLGGAHLTEAKLGSALLVGADLGGADLSYASLPSADLGAADLSEADLSHAYLGGADLTEADLTEADLHRASLTRANLTEADLTRADLTEADLTRADLSRALLGDARWPSDMSVPEGWKRDTSSGRLVPADSDLGPGEDH